MKTAEIIFLFLCVFRSSNAACSDSSILWSAYDGVVLSASSVYESTWKDYGVLNSRLHWLETVERTDAWSAGANERGQWIQADLGETFKVEAIASQGRQTRNEYVTSYSIKYSQNGRTWSNYREEATHSRKVFAGNTGEGATVVKHMLARPIKARFVRLYPLTWGSHMSLRWELYGCQVRVRGILTSPEVTLTASSEWISSKYHGAQNSRLYTKSTETRTAAWSSSKNEVGEYIEADLGKNYEVTSVATQGRRDIDQWTTSYYLTFSSDGRDWTRVPVFRKFPGNRDRNTVKENVFPAVVARYVRLYPQTWHMHMSLRWDLHVSESDGDTCQVQQDESFSFSGCSATCGAGTRARVFVCTFPNNGTRRFIREEEVCNANVACR